jgi:hypothetical protein
LKSGRNSAAEYRLVDREDLGGISLEQRADPDFFYRNEGAGRFVREPIAGNPRFVDEQGRMLAEEPEDFGLAAIFADLDGDGAPDLYVANDFEDPDQFWLNDGRGNFRLAPWFAMRSSSNSTMAVDVGDVDRDGRPDLFQVDMLSQDTRRRRDLVKLMGRWGCGSASAYAPPKRGLQALSLPGPVVGSLMAVGRNDPAVVGVDHLVGTWEASAFEFRSVVDRPQRFDLIQSGGRSTLTVGSDWRVSGTETMDGPN